MGVKARFRLGLPGRGGRVSWSLDGAYGATWCTRRHVEWLGSPRLSPRAPTSAAGRLVAPRLAALVGAALTSPASRPRRPGTMELGDRSHTISMTSSHYVHGTSPDEQRRLSRLNQLLNDSSLAALELKVGDRVLDVGSGLGQLSRRMAQVVGPRGRVLGIEQNRDQIAEAERQATLQGEAGRVEFRQGDAQSLPLAEGEWGSFDVAHARFVLEHVPDPERVVAGMLRAVRSGGRLVVED